MNFPARLLEASQRNHSQLCIGLDPDPQRIPVHFRSHPDPIYAFCITIIDATADLACAFKPNIAFFEALGLVGLQTLHRLMKSHRTVPWILDAKRGDIGSTAEAYARAVFDELQADAVTLSPYLGSDSLAPFLKRSEKGCFILCKTSNPGSSDLQDLDVGGQPLYMHVAQLAANTWNTNGNVGLVVGATHPAALAQVRGVCPDLPLLVPGVGTQGGELEAAVRAAVDKHGRQFLINASRSILYASDSEDPEQIAEAAHAEALRLRNAINSARDQ
ncbi:MAG: orotidine-5'-phosphate decarboxylase [Roseiflexaceae bacterium]|nr:orotidine-5'-phosphate decarboxylase [Roseiflexaceae bacterium]